MLNIVLLGPPGCGKGTQAVALCDRFGLDHLATGDLLREAINTQTPLGQEAQEFIKKGALVPDNLVCSMIFSKVKKELPTSHGFLFDGFPRNERQCQDLDMFLASCQLHLDGVLLLHVEERELLNRMNKRGRTDDTQAVIQHRFKVYVNETKPVVNYYKSKQLLYELDGMGHIPDITHRLVTKITQIQSNRRIGPHPNS